MRLSIIIPALNEAAMLPAVLARAASADAEIIVVDGQSCDETAAVAQRAGAKVLSCSPGRGAQLNAGAAAARGEVLLFVHADTLLPDGFAGQIEQVLAMPGTVAGAFRLAVGDRRPLMRVVEWCANGRSRLLQMPWGDQALFMPAEVFRRAGAFPDLPIMEDYQLVRRLRRLGRIGLAPGAVVTSPRLWRRRGIIGTTLINQATILGFYLGVSPQRLAHWRRRV